MARFAVYALSILLAFQLVISQENIEKNLAKGLQECYNNTALLDANMKLPMTMNLLIDLIRKVENQYPINLRVLSTSLLHRFRQDGIRKAQMVKSAKVIPYGPSGHEFDKFRIILHKLVPGSQQLFPNDTLTPLQRCALHNMLSESVETMERGDESLVCNKGEKYRLRVARNTMELSPDVELIDHESSNKKSKGKIQDQINPNSQVDTVRKMIQQNGPISTCPLEHGVVYSKWGAVSAGVVIAGIAAGTESQIVPIDNKYNLDNIFGATLAGDVAEVGYLSGANGQTLKVGADGHFTSAQVPHGYYLSKTDDFYLTDAEIRGSLDGLILGTKVKQYSSSSRNDLKLSQYLDMYYSERGLFNENIKACKRQSLYLEYASTEKLKAEAHAFAEILHKITTVLLTLNDDAVETYTNDAVDKLIEYIPTLGDVNCLIGNTAYQTAKTDLFIFLDCSWQYEIVYPILAYLFDNADMNPYNSNFTLINSFTGELIMNSQNSIADFHENFNNTFYDTLAKGFDIKVSMQTMEKIFQRKMDSESTSTHVPTAKSHIALLLTHSTNIDRTTKDFIIQRLNQVIRPDMPDLKIMALTAGPKEDFQEILKDNDVFSINDNMNSDNIVNSVSPLIKRIKKIPQRIISLRCGSKWNLNPDILEKKIVQYVEPNGINYYRVHPNYFYKSDGTRSITIQGFGGGILNVCYSIKGELPLINSPNTGNNNGTNSNGANPDDVTCKQISSEKYDIDLIDPCYGSSTIAECSPLYISVQAQPGKTSSGTVICRETGCRYPDNLKFEIEVTNLGCYNSGTILITNILLVISMLCCITIFRN